MRRPDPIPALKEQVARAVVDKLDGWTQHNAAALIHSDHRRVGDLRHGRLQRFSLEQLIRFASRLGGTVALDVAWPRRVTPRIRGTAKTDSAPAARRATCLPSTRADESRGAHDEASWME